MGRGGLGFVLTLGRPALDQPVITTELAGQGQLVRVDAKGIAMGVRGRFFTVIAIAAFAANFTLGTVNWLFWLLNPPGGNTAFWGDAGPWFQVGVDAVLALALWIVAYRMWGRVEREIAHL